MNKPPPSPSSSAELDISIVLVVRHDVQLCSDIRTCLDWSQVEPVEDDSLKTGAGRSATTALARVTDRAILMLTSSREVKQQYN